MALALFDIDRRRRRADYELDASPGLYALFLSDNSDLPGFSAPEDGLIYIGKADGAGGLAARCHFNGGTRNHSPRKSLAAILLKTLGLVPSPVAQRDGTYKTWALEPASELMLDAWMHANLLLSVVPEVRPAILEQALIRERAPLLNLTKCQQTQAHEQVRALRRLVRRICVLSFTPNRDC